MPNRLIEYCACYEALREKPLLAYGDDPLFNTPAVRHRIGRIISESLDRSLTRVASA
jgi:hypothetical protein